MEHSTPGDVDNRSATQKCPTSYGIRRFIILKFQVLAAASVKLTAFWDIAPCCSVEVDERFRDVYCLHNQVFEFTLWRRQYFWNVGKRTRLHCQCPGRLSHSYIAMYKIIISWFLTLHRRIRFTSSHWISICLKVLRKAREIITCWFETDLWAWSSQNMKPDCYPLPQTFGTTWQTLCLVSVPATVARHWCLYVPVQCFEPPPPFQRPQSAPKRF
jgi:hypothetical protein